MSEFKTTVELGIGTRYDNQEEKVVAITLRDEDSRSATVELRLPREVLMSALMGSHTGGVEATFRNIELIGKKKEIRKMNITFGKNQYSYCKETKIKTVRESFAFLYPELLEDGWEIADLFNSQESFVFNSDTGGFIANFHIARFVDKEE